MERVSGGGMGLGLCDRVKDVMLWNGLGFWELRFVVQYWHLDILDGNDNWSCFD